jgi:NitT/TauT family transport system ATP-binding protein
MAYRIENIAASYDGLAVLDGISLTLRHGAVTVVLGPSGCGKTTLLNVIAGLKLFDAGRREGFEGCRFSYAFQDDRLLPWLNARENLAYVLSGSLPRDEASARIDRFLAASGLAAFSRSRPRELSGGMRQRLSLARAFAYPSDVLLLDEAFKAVDLRTKIDLMDTFLNLMREEGRTVVAVTHDLEEAVYLADDVVVLSERPARVIDAFSVNVRRSERALGSNATMEAESRLYRLVLGSREGLSNAASP